MSRAGYKFSKALRREREVGINFCCEQCGKEASLQFHHLIPCYFASQNPALTPQLIKSLENCQGLCHDCHKKADENLFQMSKHDIALLAWALFDIDPASVKASHGRTPPVKKKRRHRRFEERQERKQRKWITDHGKELR